MKKILLAVTMAISLSSCAVYDAYFMAHFDPNEYQYITRIRTHAELGNSVCDNPVEAQEQAKYLWMTAREFKNYADAIPDNEKTIPLTVSLNALTEEFYKRYQSGDKVSSFYCKAKFTAINESSINIQKVIGAKPR